MKVISGTVVDGKVDVPTDALADGDRVAIVAAEPAELIELTPEQRCRFDGRQIGGCSTETRHLTHSLTTSSAVSG